MDNLKLYNSNSAISFCQFEFIEDKVTQFKQNLFARFVNLSQPIGRQALSKINL